MSNGPGLEDAQATDPPSEAAWSVPVMTPVLLRLFSDFLFGCMAAWCCGFSVATTLNNNNNNKSNNNKEEKKEEDEEGDALLGYNIIELALSNIAIKVIPFQQATKWMGIPDLKGVCIAFFRLLLWHLLQPTMYFLVFIAYWPLLDPAQRVFGIAVAFREAFYAISCIIAVYVNPVYLLPDLRASVNNNDNYAVIMYGLAPERFVSKCVAVSFENKIPDRNSDEFKESGMVLTDKAIKDHNEEEKKKWNERWRRLNMYFLVPIDFCAIAAMITAVIVHRVYVPMFLGYVVTSIAGFVTCTLLSCVKVSEIFKDICDKPIEENDDNNNNNEKSNPKLNQTDNDNDAYLQPGDPLTDKEEETELEVNEADVESQQLLPDSDKKTGQQFGST